MLIDRAVVEVRSGNGGDGHISFLHDKNTEWGGPDGGNGGDGGSVYFLAKNNLNTLFPFRHSPLLSAEDGEKGMKKLMAGKRGNDLIVEVPTGTVVIDERDGHVLADLDEPGKKALVAKGGRGGRGNASYKSSRRRIPRIAQNGEKGERFRIVRPRRPPLGREEHLPQPREPGQRPHGRLSFLDPFPEPRGHLPRGREFLRRGRPPGLN